MTIEPTSTDLAEMPDEPRVAGSGGVPVEIALGGSGRGRVTHEVTDGWPEVEVTATYLVKTLDLQEADRAFQDFYDQVDGPFDRVNCASSHEIAEEESRIRGEALDDVKKRLKGKLASERANADESGQPVSDYTHGLLKGLEMALDDVSHVRMGEEYRLIMVKRAADGQ